MTMTRDAIPGERPPSRRNGPGDPVGDADRAAREGGRQAGRSEVRRVGALAPTLVGLGAACVVVAVVGVVWTHLGQRADERSRWSIALPDETRAAVMDWLDLVSVPFVAVGMIAAVVLALVQGRVRRAAAAALLVAGANVTTQVLKAGIPRPFYGIGSDNSLPSGHTTVLVSLSLAAILVLPRPLRAPAVFLASAVGTFTGAAVVVERWHRPSDVVAAFGVCGLWAGLALLVAGAVHVGRVRPARRFWLHLACGLVGAAVVGALLVAGGLVAHGETTNVLVGGVMLTVLGLSSALLCALVAVGADSRDAPRAG